MAHHYSLVGRRQSQAGSLDNEVDAHIRRSSATSTLVRSIFVFLSWLLCVWAGYIIRDHIGTETSLVHTTFLYNRTYSSRPSAQSDRAWDELFPVGDGFVRSISGNISAFSAFHQLHCLNTLRHVTYDLLDLASDVNAVEKDAAELKHATSHAMHCFDYLRQNIQCSADDTLEAVIPELGGVSGWNTVHRCRDFDDLRRRAADIAAPSASVADHH